MMFVYQHYIAPWFSIIALVRLLLGRDSKVQTGNRFGNPSSSRHGPVIWLHAASVGELQSVKRLLKYLNRQHSKYQILVTVNNPTALKLAANWGDISITLQAAPMDSSGSLTRFLDHWQPVAFINVEGELWPNRLLQLSLRNTPVVFVNARLSQKSARRLGWVGLGKPMLMKVTALFCQDAQTARNLITLGVDEQRIEVTKNLKSLLSETKPHVDLSLLQQIFKHDKTILAASTHMGEDEVILAAFAKVNAIDPTLKLILAPRHPKRASEVAKLISAAGFTYVQRSAEALPNAETQVYLADTLGEMDLFYQLAAITIVGGSLVPKRGHTPYEPVHFGSAVISGPSFDNFTVEYQNLKSSYGCIIVEDRDTLSDAFTSLLDAEIRARQVSNASDVLCVKTDAQTLFNHMLTPLRLSSGDGNE